MCDQCPNTNDSSHIQDAMKAGALLFELERKGYEVRLASCSLDPKQFDLVLHDPESEVSLEIIHPMQR